MQPQPSVKSPGGSFFKKNNIASSTLRTKNSLKMNTHTAQLVCSCTTTMNRSIQYESSNKNLKSSLQGGLINSIEQFLSKSVTFTFNSLCNHSLWSLYTLSSKYPRANTIITFLNHIIRKVSGQVKLQSVLEVQSHFENKLI